MSQVCRVVIQGDIADISTKCRKFDVHKQVQNYVYEQKSKNYSTQYSQVVPHPSTNCANSSLTSEIRRDPVYSTVYGRS